MKKKTVIGFLFVFIIFGSFLLSGRFLFHGDEGGTRAPVVLEKGEKTFYLQREKDKQGEWSLEVTVQNAALYEDELPDEDGYYSERGILQDILRYPYQGKQMVYEDLIRYIVVDLEIRNKKEYEQVYRLDELRIFSAPDEGDLDETSLVPADYRIFTKEDSTWSMEEDILHLNGGAEIQVQIVYTSCFAPEFTLYDPCMNLADGKYAEQNEDGKLEDCFVSLKLDLYETDYPLIYREQFEDDMRGKANRTPQETDNSLYKATTGDTNYEIAIAEGKNALQVSDDRIVPEGSILTDGLNSNGELDRTEAYTEIRDLKVHLYDSIEELPEYFRDSEALKRMTERYADKPGCGKEALSFLTVQAEYAWYQDGAKRLHWQPLSAAWLYDRKEDGYFYAYGYPDDYRILKAETEGNVDHSPYLYLNNGDSALVELVYILLPDSYEELYFSSFTPLLWQDALDSEGMAIQFMKVLGQGGYE